MLDKHVASVRRYGTGVLVGAAATLAFAPAAFAAGSGYVSTTPNASVPTGFTHVATARGVSTKASSFKVKTAGGTVKVTVPKKAFSAKAQVAVTKGSNSTVKKDLAKSLKKDKVITSFGIELKKGAKTTTSRKAVKVIFTDKKIARGDKVVVYSSKTGKFSVLKGAKVSKGEITVTLRAGESLAVIS